MADLGAVGAAPGVDASFRNACYAVGVPEEPHEANWSMYKDRAGPVRNRAMVGLGAALRVALHRDLARAIRAAIPTYLIATDEGQPGRIEQGDPRLA
jgi:hypothetical protein